MTRNSEDAGTAAIRGRAGKRRRRSRRPRARTRTPEQAEERSPAGGYRDSGDHWSHHRASFIDLCGHRLFQSITRGDVALSFPVYFHLGPWTLHPYVVLEALAYFIGFRVYLWTRTPGRMPALTGLQIIAGAAVGAAAGSKVLYWLEDPQQTLLHLADYAYMMGGKTIVGGLLGGLIGVELVKRWIGWSRLDRRRLRASAGDRYVHRADRSLPHRAGGPYLRHADALDHGRGLRGRGAAASDAAV
ncbi:hypothetical protein LJK88_48910 [Paenibacillus sp. P26]|nr:hypothetical protein LJK88_48910 [Paenibacillus sp. P26]